MSTKQRLILYATDTYRLSSLLLRHVLLAAPRPTTIAAFRERTRQLLLDQSKSVSANLAAVKLLQWDREINLMQYHGFQEYTKMLWSSVHIKPLWSFSGTNSIGGSNNSSDIISSGSANKNNSKNVARVAFMITSEQRRKLSVELGYTAQDIRSFKPIEALLLIEHNVKREVSTPNADYDFRVILKELMEENDRLMSMQQQEKDKLKNIERVEPAPTTEQSTLTPEEAEQKQAKPDVAIALLYANKDDGDVSYMGEKEDSTSSESKAVAIVDETKISDSVEKSSPPASVGEATTTTEAAVSDEALKAPTKSALINVTPNESKELHMKPDVAAAILTSHKQTEQTTQQMQESFVDEKDDSSEGLDEDGACWYEVVERIPTRNGNSYDLEANVQVIALFPTKKEALECVRIKQSFRSRSENASNEEGEESFAVRRRWNV